MLIAYCYASGHIEFGETVPRGAIELARGNKATVRSQIEVAARHGYDGKTLLVPGVPEAADQDAAGDALELFLLWIKARERRGFRVAIKPRNPFEREMYGMTVQSVTVDDRVRDVASFDRAQCMAGLLVDHLQTTVRKAIHRRLRGLTIERGFAA